jgi:hypothetical protein
VAEITDGGQREMLSIEFWLYSDEQFPLVGSMKDME